jgi:hypothetical protein
MFCSSAKITSLLFCFTILIQHSTTTASTTSTTKTLTMAPNPKSNLSKASPNGECATSLDLLADLRKKYPHQPTFLQAVEEMALSLQSLFTDPKEGEFYQRAFLAMTEPERTISFRVPWEDDAGVMHFNRGWRVEFNRYVYVSRTRLKVTDVYLGAYIDHITSSCVRSFIRDMYTHSLSFLLQRPRSLQRWSSFPCRR